MPSPIFVRIWTSGGWIDGKQRGQITGACSFGAAVAEAEVDIETGVVKVLKFTAAKDCGFAINPMTVEGQIGCSVLFNGTEVLYSQVGTNGIPYIEVAAMAFIQALKW